MKIEISDISVSYGGPTVLHGVSIGIESGQIVSLIGANGSGKSTLIKAMARSIGSFGGRICLDGRNIVSYRRNELALKIAFLPQTHYVPEDMTVHDLVCCGRFPHRHLTGACSRKKDAEAVDRAISLTRLENLRMRQVSSLSGGEKQRAWIALNIAQEPEVMLLDEPTTFLDVRCQFETLDLIRRMNGGLGTTVIMALHDLNHAAHYSHRIVSMKEGRIFKEGTPADVIREDVMKAVFGIKSRITFEAGVPYFMASGVDNPEYREEP